MTKTTIVAEIISLILSPLVLLAPVPFFLVYEQTNSLSSSTLWSIISILFIFIFFLIILVGVRVGVFSDFDISKREQRPLLFSLAMVLTFIYLVTLFLLHAPQDLLIGTTAIILGLVVIGAVNIFTKVSGHLTVLSAFVTFLILAEGWRALITLLLIPLLIWARIQTKNHTLIQTILGTILGSATIITIYVIFKYILGHA
jgi:membrane-associated phospholipid phosphatase